ncbi:MAG: alkaline phosphatase family protein [Thermodesulfobacteriota bacterium]|nr:alkaline phosphatase family protein [Thermodesulfobacteriota bacterium]
MTDKKNSTILIGLDGATFSILDPLMKAGKMPCLSEFASSGVRTELASTIPPITPPAWTSIMTGKGPGNHGIFDFFRPESPGSHFLRLVNSKQITCETIWSLLTRQGFQSTCLNFPVMSPPIPISGYSISGFVTWRHLRQACYPPDLMDTLKRIPGFDLKIIGHNFSLEEKVIVGCPPEEAEEWIRYHTLKDRQWFLVLQYLAKTDPCHLSAIVFDSPDRLQHVFWHLLDNSCYPGHPTEEEKKIREFLYDHYCQLDRMIAEIVSTAGPRTNIFIVSDHGFGPSYERLFLNSCLENLGYLTWSEKPVSVEEGTGDVSMDAIRRHGQLLDWSKTTAYVDTPSSNGVRINVIGRNCKYGINSSDYGSFLEKLRKDLEQIKHPQTGNPVITRTWTRNEAFSGSELAPDLTIQLWDHGLVSTLKSNSIIKSRSQCTGVHYPNGIFMAKGPGIRRGAKVDILNILDVAPLLLYSLGLPVPEDYEGNVPVDIFDPDVLKKKPVKRGESTLPVDNLSIPSFEMEKEERDEIIDRLKGLGYLD